MRLYFEKRYGQAGQWKGDWKSRSCCVTENKGKMPETNRPVSVPEPEHVARASQERRGGGGVGWASHSVLSSVCGLLFSVVFVCLVFSSGAVTQSAKVFVEQPICPPRYTLLLLKPES